MLRAWLLLGSIAWGSSGCSDRELGGETDANEPGEPVASESGEGAMDPSGADVCDEARVNYEGDENITVSIRNTQDTWIWLVPESDCAEAPFEIDQADLPEGWYWFTEGDLRCSEVPAHATEDVERKGQCEPAWTLGLAPGASTEVDLDVVGWQGYELPAECVSQDDFAPIHCAARRLLPDGAYNLTTRVGTICHPWEGEGDDSLPCGHCDPAMDTCQTGGGIVEDPQIVQTPLMFPDQTTAAFVL